jgi:hypothetical protein
MEKTMWTFVQRTGDLLHDGTARGTGYSGAAQGKNNPEMQTDKGIGPIPCGFYSIAGLIDRDPACGEYVLVLTPDEANEMFGRTGFRWHGDSIEHPGQASHGCIVSARALRTEAWEGADHSLQVISGI